MVAPLTKTMAVKEEEWHGLIYKAIDPVGVRSTYSDNHINSNRNNAIHISCLYSGIEAEELITKIQFSRVSGACMQIFVSFFTFSGQKRGHLYLKSPSIPPTALSETLGTIVSHPLFHLYSEMNWNREILLGNQVLSGSLSRVRVRYT